MKMKAKGGVDPSSSTKFRQVDCTLHGWGTFGWWLELRMKRGGVIFTRYYVAATVPSSRERGSVSHCRHDYWYV